MFNTNDPAHEAAVLQLARALAENPDGAWKKDVARRYAAYLRILATEAEAELTAAMERGLPDTDQAREHVARTRDGIRQHREFARDLDTGVTAPNAPARCEALCRIFEANRQVTL